MRVLAITANASLAVALGSMMRDWEVVTVRTIEEATASHSESVVALIDLGDSEEGLGVADELYRSGITIPSVVIGDRQIDHPRASVLTRPFSLEELGVAVREASVRVFEAPSPPPAPEPEPPRAVEPAPPPAAPTPEISSDAPSRGGMAPARRPGERPQQGRPRPLSVVRPEPEPEELEPELEPAPVQPEPAAVDPAAVQEPAVVEPETTPGTEVPEQAEEVYEPEPAAYSEPALPEPEPEPEPEPIAHPEIVDQPPRYAPPLQPAPVARPVAPAASVAQGVAATARPLPQDDSAGRWRKRRKPGRVETEESVEPPLVRRLKVAAAQLMDVGALIEELPVLADVRALAEALVGEIESQFSAPIASVFARGDDGFHAIAHTGLSRVEAGMVVPETQPLFSDVLQTQEGILIQPVDLAQGLVAGIGGARTEALMAAPAVLGGQTVAVVVVGGDRFDEGDLDRLSDLATEAAPGLAVALLLRRLRGNE